MDTLITQHANLRNAQFAQHGMELPCAVRNTGGMKRQGLITARKRQKVTQEVIAERMDVSVAQVSRWENGHDGIPSQRLASLAAAYGASLSDLLGDGESPVASNAVVQQFEGASLQRMRQDLPILGTALGAEKVVDGQAIEQTYLYEHEIIGHAKRPIVLDGRADAYGIYVQGTSMEPEYRDGSLILVETKRRPATDDNVVVYLRQRGDEHEADDGETARMVLVKRLVRRSASYIELEQHNPKLMFRIDMKDVLKMDRVIPWMELLS